MKISFQTFHHLFQIFVKSILQEVPNNFLNPSQSGGVTLAEEIEENIVRCDDTTCSHCGKDSMTSVMESQ